MPLAGRSADLFTCDGPLRPNILMPGDAGWLGSRADQQRALLHAWLHKVRRPVVIEPGAGTHVPSVRNFSNQVVRLHEGRLIRIAPRETDVPSLMDVGVTAGALEGLRSIDVALEAQKSE